MRTNAKVFDIIVLAGMVVNILSSGLSYSLLL